MAWILVVALLAVAAGLALALARQRSALNAEVSSAGNIRRERDEARSDKEALDARLAELAAAETARAAAEAARAAAEAARATAEAARATEEAARATEEAAAEEAARAADEAAAAAAGAGESGPAGSPAVEARLAALWALAQIEQQRTWRLSMASAIDGDPGLAGALAMEVDRIREDVGTPGSLETRLDPPVAVHDAALALLAARELLAALVPHTQAYDLAVGYDGAHLAIEVVCTGWEGPAGAADDVSRLLAAIAPAGGDLSVDTNPDGRLRATLQLPLAR
jgi:multidrug efflux pump subunit AcrA (membrane-fusion protein)